MTHPPEWLEQLADDVAALMTPVDVLAPIGCHIHQDEETGQWEVTVFASSTETFGGPFDGQATPSRFHLRLDELSNLLTSVTSFGWIPLPVEGAAELGAHISIEGQYEGHDVWLRIPATAPPDAPIGRSVNALSGEIAEVW